MEYDLPTVEEDRDSPGVVCLRNKYEIAFPRTCPADGKDECVACSKAIVDKITEVFKGATYAPCEGTWFNPEDKMVYEDHNLCITALYSCVKKDKLKELRQLVRECGEKTKQSAILETKGHYPHVISTVKKKEVGGVMKPFRYYR